MLGVVLAAKKNKYQEYATNDDHIRSAARSWRMREKGSINEDNPNKSLSIAIECCV